MAKEFHSFNYVLYEKFLLELFQSREFLKHLPIYQNYSS